MLILTDYKTLNMIITLNNQPIEIPEGVKTVSDLMKLKNISTQGTAIALNDKLLLKKDWDVKNLEDMMNVTIISAAFGG